MDSFRCIKPCVESEFGKLEYVMLHAPGNEIENMTPENAHKFLFSDILNKNEAMADYKDFFGTLSKVSNVVVFDQLLEETLQNDKVKQQVVEKICTNENVKYLIPILSEMSAAELAKVLVEGFQSKGLKERFVLDPIPNLFFMRDASFTMFGDIIINKMATDVRDRETILLDAIFRNTKLFNTEVVHPIERYTPRPGGSIEGGDVHIARHDIVLSGMGLRTNRIGIDALISHLKSKNAEKHLIFQELPSAPESFIHLDMVFTLLGQNKCMAYKQVIMNSQFKTTHLVINGENPVKIIEEENLVSALNNLGMELEPIFCGDGDDYAAAREQWHSGANFFSFAPGKILGYERNNHTIEALSNSGFEVLKASDVANGIVNVDDYKQCVVTFKGNELARGGGGARCMTMPLVRKS